MQEYINCYDSGGVLKKYVFENEFKSYVNEYGGILKFNELLKNTSLLELDNIPIYFLLYFQDKNNVTLPKTEELLFQEHIYDFKNYLTLLNRITYDYNSRSSSPSNIIFYLILALAVIGLVSLCSNN